MGGSLEEGSSYMEGEGRDGVMRAGGGGSRSQ